MDRIFEEAFITGSKSFGTDDQFSDWDICVLEKSGFGKVRSVIKDLFPIIFTDDNTYFNGVKYVLEKEDKLPSKIINVITLQKKDFLAWYFATLAMENTYKHSLDLLYKNLDAFVCIYDERLPSLQEVKQKKYFLFQSLVASYGLYYPVLSGKPSNIFNEVLEEWRNNHKELIIKFKYELSSYLK